MKLARVFILFISNFLTLIGDLVIAIIYIFWILFKIIISTSDLLVGKTLGLPRSFFKKINFRKTHEKEIYSSKRKLPRLKLSLNFKKRINLLNLRIRKRKRGRPRLPLAIPYSTKFKYLFVGSFVSFVFIFLPLYIYTFINSLPSPKALAQQEIAQTTKIYDRGGTLLYQIYANQDRTVVPISNIPDSLKNATIAIEDKNFYKTPGIDIFAIGRSVFANLSGEPLQGGSTITQQLIKARLLTPERTIERKVKEIVLALWAERIYTKDEILEMYLNQVPYGGTAWGAEAAAQTYFGKSVKDLTLSESAFLAGLPRAPSIYSPYGADKSLWKARQKEVLARMVNLGFIKDSRAKEAEAQELVFKTPNQALYAPHFVMYVRDVLIEKYGISMIERGGLAITTSLDLPTQDFAQKVVREEVEKNAYLNISNAATLITNPATGDILAMVGGVDYFGENGGNYNVTTALRQPGSTIKVVTYAQALLNGLTAATSIQDSPVTYRSEGTAAYSPVNYDGKFHGTVTLRNALGNSINIPAVKTLNRIGVSAMVELAKKMGITSWEEPENYGLALTLGAAEVKMTDLATLYGAFANQGDKVDLNPILKIVDSEGNIIEEKKEVRKTNVIPKEIAFIISDILADNRARLMEFGSSSPLNIPGHKVSVKTGTTDNKRDNWTIGFTPSLLIAVWVGNNDNSPMNPRLASGISGAAPIWNRLMTQFLSSSDPKTEIPKIPENIVVKSCGGRDEYFVKGTENLAFCRPLSSLTEGSGVRTP